jgi:hypothetical protein
LSLSWTAKYVLPAEIENGGPAVSARTGVLAPVL